MLGIGREGFLTIILPKSTVLFFEKLPSCTKCSLVNYKTCGFDHFHYQIFG